MQKYLSEVERRLKRVSAKAQPARWRAEDYVGGETSQLVYLNLKIPNVRAEYRAGFSFSGLEPAVQWKVWNYIWRNSRVFEAMLCASYWVASRSIEEQFENRRFILKWLVRVDNWAHSDELSAHFARLLEHSPTELLPVFKKWNSSSQPWFKRQSVVGLMYYSRMRRKCPSKRVLLEFIDRHLDDPHYYVQKGVGWALRESWNVYPQSVFTYLKRNAHRIPPAGWTAATEKLSKLDKAHLTKLREQRRKFRSVSHIPGGDTQ